MTSRYFRSLVMMLLFDGLVLFGILAAPALAHEQNGGPSTGGQTAASPTPTEPPGSRGAPAVFDPTARIKYLHDRLRITPEQEPLWDTVAQTMRDNAQDIVPLLRERLRAKTSGTALDVLHAYEALGENQQDSLKKFIAAFDPLYASLSESQRKIADAILREGAVNTLVGGIPEVPLPFGSPLSYQFYAPSYGPWFWNGLRGPMFVRRFAGLPQFHGFVGVGHFGRFRR
jgi:protein CpxP